MDLCGREEVMKVNIHEAKIRLSELLVKVEGGGEVTIARAGKPIARLIPLHKHQGKRIPGLAKGKITIRDDFDAPLPKATLSDFGL